MLPKRGLILNNGESEIERLPFKPGKEPAGFLTCGGGGPDNGKA
jgi:hypothetical protein